MSADPRPGFSPGQGERSKGRLLRRGANSALSERQRNGEVREAERREFQARAWSAKVWRLFRGYRELCWEGDGR